MTHIFFSIAILILVVLTNVELQNNGLPFFGWLILAIYTYNLYLQYENQRRIQRENDSNK